MTRDIGFWQGILDTAEGRGKLRFLLQPTISIILGIRLGLADAKAHRDPFLLRLFVTGKNRLEIAKEALRDVIVPFSIAIVLDGILQYFALGYVRPMAAVAVGATLVWVPFSLSRAFTDRIARRTRHHGTAASTH